MTHAHKQEVGKHFINGIFSILQVITQRMESDEMVDEIEKLRKEKETLKSEIKQNNAELSILNQNKIILKNVQ
jgi:cell division protein FtsB